MLRRKGVTPPEPVSLSRDNSSAKPLEFCMTVMSDCGTTFE